jgi:hypothetical protein
MTVFFLCEVGAFTRESKDVLEVNVTSCREGIATSGIYTIFLEFLHYLPPVGQSVFLPSKSVTKYVFSFTPQSQRFGFGGSL